MAKTVTIAPRAQLVRALRKRDGDMCQHPDCGLPIDFTIEEGPLEPTIDHWMPQWWGKEQGWSPEKIWAVKNLKLMHKKCNAKKGDLLPNPDGTLPKKPQSTFKFRRQKRAGRPELCSECDNGHNLLVGEICANCGCNAQRFPKSAKVKYPDCDHELLWCWLCSITPEMRPASVDIAVRQGESGEWDGPLDSMDDSVLD